MPETSSQTQEVLEEINSEVSETKEDFVAPQIGEGKYLEGIGRRKRAVARVRIWDDKDNTTELNILVNGRSYLDYFKNIEFQKIVSAPLRKLKIYRGYKVTCWVRGGGLRGQAEAIRLGLSRALILLNPEWRSKFKKAGFLTRDPREVERKKYGKRKARKEEQWQKR